MSSLKTHIANQRLFNEAWEHIHAQGCASVLEAGDVRYENGFCRYQTTAGLGCAMAPAIKDYDPNMEATGAAELLLDFSDNLHDWIRGVDPVCATRIQNCHDSATEGVPRDEFMADFELHMRDCAQRFNLEVPA